MQAEFFKALGDPTRLELVQRLASGSEYTLSSLSKGLPLSRQGVRKHVQILEDSNIVSLQVKGRDTQVTLNKQALTKAKTFITHLEHQWDERLQKLKNVIEEKQ